MKATANRRKSKLQLKEEKLQAEAQAAEVQAKLANYAQLEAANNDMQEKLGMAAVLHNSVQKMFDEGLLAQDPDGNYRVVDDPGERAQICSKTKSIQGSQMDNQSEPQFHEMEDIGNVAIARGPR